MLRATLPTDRLRELPAALVKSWSLASSTKWTAENPALGQCGVTALVVHDLFGGDVLKTPYGDIQHFYNRISGRRLDFTASQFSAPIEYLDLPSDRREAFADTNAEQYASLRKALFQAMGQVGD